MIDEQEKVVNSPENTQNQSNVEEMTTDNYIANIKKLKENSVSKDMYEKLQQANQALADELLNSKKPEVVEAEVVVDLDSLRKELFNTDSDLNNLEYVEKALVLRDELIKRGQPDPFLPIGKRISPTHDDIEAAERVATVLKDCVERADGDSLYFTNELQRRTNDIRIR